MNQVTAGLSAAVRVKVEFTNPGGQRQGPAALDMVRDAERSGALVPGGVIVEGSSGNTGVGLAMVAAQLGYRSVVVVPKTIAREKIALLRAYGARVVPTDPAVPREHPEHVIWPGGSWRGPRWAGTPTSTTTRPTRACTS